MKNRDKFIEDIKKYSDYNLACLILDHCINVCDYCVHDNNGNLPSYDCPHNCIDGVIAYLNMEE